MNIKLHGEPTRGVEPGSVLNDTWSLPPELSDASNFAREASLSNPGTAIAKVLLPACALESSLGDADDAISFRSFNLNDKSAGKHVKKGVLALGEALPKARTQSEDFRDWLSVHLEERLETHREKTCEDIKAYIDVLEATLHGLWLPFSRFPDKDYDDHKNHKYRKSDSTDKRAEGFATEGASPRSLRSHSGHSISPVTSTSLIGRQSPITSFLAGNQKISVAGMYSISSTPLCRVTKGSTPTTGSLRSKTPDPNDSTTFDSGRGVHSSRRIHGSANWFIKRSASEDLRMKQIRETIASHRAPDKRRGAVAAGIWDFLENPFSSRWAWYYSIFVPMFVVSSVTVSIMQTIPGFPLDGVADTMVQTAVELLFAIELLVRFAVCPNRWSFWLSFFNYVDMISTAPVILRIVVLTNEALGEEAKTARHLLTGMAAVPVLRLLKVTRRFEKFQLLLAAFQIAVEALPVLLYTMMLICLMFSALVYVIEREGNNDAGQSLPRAMWYVIVTMTTVGYGDITPSTPLGHIVTCGLMVVSALYMAMPIGIVGNAFSQVWGDRDRLLLMQRLRDAFLQGGFTPSGIHAIMRIFDQDGSGELDVEEFQVMLKAMHIHMGEARVYKLFHILDQHDQGVVNVEDFMKGVFPNCVAAMRKSCSTRISGSE